MIRFLSREFRGEFYRVTLDNFDRWLYRKFVDLGSILDERIRKRICVSESRVLFMKQFFVVCAVVNTSVNTRDSAAEGFSEKISYWF